MAFLAGIGGGTGAGAGASAAQAAAASGGAAAASGASTAATSAAAANVATAAPIQAANAATGASTATQGAMAAAPQAGAGLQTATAGAAPSTTTSALSQLLSGGGGGSSTPGLLGGLFGKSSGQGSQAPNVPSLGQSVMSSPAAPLRPVKTSAPGPSTPRLAKGGVITDAANAEAGGFLGLDKATRNSLFQQAMLQLAMPGQRGGPSELPQIGGGAGLQGVIQSLGGMPQMAGGGTIANGQAIVGEAGPELATHTPQGTVITPLSKLPKKGARMQEGGVIRPGGTTVNVQEAPRPQAEAPAPSPGVPAAPALATPQAQATAPVSGAAGGTQGAFPRRAAATATPEQPQGFGAKLWEGFQDVLITGAALQNPQIFAQMRSEASAAKRQTAFAAIQNPQLLELSPTFAAAVNATTGNPGTAQALIERNDPGAHNELIAIASGVDVVPEGTPMPDGTPAPHPNQQLTMGLRRQGIGVKIDKDGRIIPNIPSASLSERSSAAGFASWDEKRTQLVQQGVHPVQADKLAAQAAITEMRGAGYIPPTQLLELALADTNTSIEASRRRLVKHNEMIEEQNFARGIAAERAAGGVVGEATAKAQLPFMHVNVTQPDGSQTRVPLSQAGAVAATGEIGAVSLGTNPSKTQKDLAASQGKDLLFGPGGEIIAVPPGVGLGMPVTPAAAVVKGPEASTALDNVRKTSLDVLSGAFLGVHPSERLYGREAARGTGFLQSYIRGFTDPADVATTRGNVRQLGFQMARLLGSNSQLSDSERANAQAVWQPVIDGVASQEQIVAAAANTLGYLNLNDSRTREKRVPKDGVDEFLGSGGPRTGVNALADQLAIQVESNRMKKEEAVAIIQTVRGALLGAKKR